MHDLACVVHLHSTYSDGTGTVRQIAKAGRARRGRRGAAHRSRHARGRAQRRGGLVRRRAAAGGRGGLAAAAATTTSPSASTRRSTTPGSTRAGICRAVRAAGGFGFAAHPFSHGLASASSAPAPACRSTALDCEALDGIELWSFVNRHGRVPSRASARWSASWPRPGACSTTRPSATCAAWDELCRTAPRRRDRRPRRPPVRQADRAGRAAADHGLPPLVPLHPHARAVRGARRRGELEHDREPSTRPFARAAATSRSTRSRPRAASRSRRTTCRWAPRRPPPGAS